MAPIGEKSDRDNFLGDPNDEDEDQNLWANILKEVQKSSSTKLPSNKSLLVLGENESGKTTLIAKLQGQEDPKKGAGLEYHYISVKDEYRDDHTRLGVWILDGDPFHSGLLKFALREENFTDSVVVLMVSMAQPWFIMDTLHKWSTILSDHIERLRIARDKRKEFEDKLVRDFQEYVEPDKTEVNPRRSGMSMSTSEDDNVLLPLGETTLTHNLGLPVVVVVTKSDAISTLEKEHDYREEHFDFIQQHIRKFCLNYGAALIYNSVKEEKNCDLLYKYVTHKIYGFPFSTPAYVVERDSVFIPAGWDNEKKISILYENMTNMKHDDVYEDVIIKPVTRKPIQRDAEVVAEDEQVFLMKQQTALSKQPAPSTRPESSQFRPPSVQKSGVPSPRSSVTTSPGLAGSSPNKKIDPTKGAASSEGVLANFFNSLLSKKTGASPTGSPAPKGSERAAMSRDAAAELDRMTRAKKPQTAPTQNSNANS